MITEQTIFQVVMENMLVLQHDFHLIKIGIFGSYANGTSRDKSDIDVLVKIQQGHKDLFNLHRLREFLESKLGLPIDLVTEDALKPRIKQNILLKVHYVS